MEPVLENLNQLYRAGFIARSLMDSIYGPLLGVTIGCDKLRLETTLDSQNVSLEDRKTLRT